MELRLNEHAGQFPNRPPEDLLPAFCGDLFSNDGKAVVEWLVRQGPTGHLLRQGAGSDGGGELQDMECRGVGGNDHDIKDSL
jgi:hypothetical protein